MDDEELSSQKADERVQNTADGAEDSHREIPSIIPRRFVNATRYGLTPTAQEYEAARYNLVMSYETPHTDPFARMATAMSEVNSLAKEASSYGTAYGPGFSINRKELGDKILNSAALRFIQSSAAIAQFSRDKIAGFDPVQQARFGPLTIEQEEYIKTITEIQADLDNPALSAQYRQVASSVEYSGSLVNTSGAYRLVSNKDLAQINKQAKEYGHTVNTVGQRGGITIRMPVSAESIPNSQGSDTLHQSLQGFISRASASDYIELFNTSGKLKASFFQLQNTEIAASLLHREGGYDLITQRYTANDDKTNTRILAPNELLFAIHDELNRVPGTILGRQLNTQMGAGSVGTNVTSDPNSQRTVAEQLNILNQERKVHGIYHASSFHPKIGYVGDEGGTQYAFIGTQNITPALSRNKSVESLLIINRRAGQLDEALFKEIQTYTDTIHDIAQTAEELRAQNSVVRNDNLPLVDIAPGQVLNRFEQLKEVRGIQSKFLYTSDPMESGGVTMSEIGHKITSTISKAAKSIGDKVFISMGEISSLLTVNSMSETVKTFKTNLLSLASEGRLHLITDNRKLNDSLGGGIDQNFIGELASKGAIHTANTLFHHDKSIAIFDSSNGLKFFSIGSANFSERSLNLNNNPDTSTNTEVVLAMGIGEYLENAQDEQATKDYLGRMTGKKRTVYELVKNPQGALMMERRVEFLKDESGNYIQDESSEFLSHYNTLSRGSLLTPDKEKNQKGYLSERRSAYSADRDKISSQLATLHSQIENLNSQIGMGQKLIKAEFRYSVEQEIKNSRGSQENLAPTGLRVTINSPTGDHKLVVDLSATSEGNVVLTDLNKLITGALYTNATSSEQTLHGLAYEKGQQRYDRQNNLVETTEGERVTVQRGRTFQLSANQATIGIIQTIQREFVFQQEHALVNLVFHQEGNQNYEHLQTALKKLIAGKIVEQLPQLATEVTPRPGQAFAEPANLYSLLHRFYLEADEGGKEVFRLALDRVQADIADNNVGRFLTPADGNSRVAAMAGIFPALLETKHIESGFAQNNFVSHFMDLLQSDQEGLFDDVKKALIESTPEGLHKFRSAAKAQSRVVMSELTAPFLAAHEETYSYYQGQGRLAVYGENQNFEVIHGDSEYTRVLRAGIMNPLALTHGTNLGDAGGLYRSLAATAYGKPLGLPGYGGLRQLTVVDSDLSSQAAVAQDFQLMLKTTPGMALIDKDRYRQTMLSLIQATDPTRKELNEQEEKALEAYFATPRYAVTFPKIDQLTQRLKNIVGQRGALDLSNEFIGNTLKALNAAKDEFDKYNLNIKSEFGAREFSADDILSGNIRTALPQEQFEDIARTKEILTKSLGHAPSFEEIRTYYREKQLDPLSVQRGFIGPSRMRRIAINTGVSLFGDFSYTNPAYKQTVGSMKRLRVKLNLNSVDNALEAEAAIKYALQKGAVNISTPTTQLDGTVLEAGLYVPDEKGAITKAGKVATYTDSGFLQLENVYKQKDTVLGRSIEPITFKMSAFSKRTEEGVTVVTSSPTTQFSSRDTMIIEVDTVTFKSDGSSNRLVGSGLAKGPVQFLQEQVFSKLQGYLETHRSLVESPSGASYSSLKQSGHLKLMPTEIKQDSVYALTSFNIFKGFDYGVGLYLLGDSQVRSTFKDTSQVGGLEIAKALSLLFTKDKAVRDNLAGTLKAEGLTTLAKTFESMKKGKTDVSEARQGALAVTAAGLNVLAGTEATNIESLVDSGAKQNALAVVKSLVIDALSSDRPVADTAREKLRTQFSTLLNMVEDESRGQVYKEKSGTDLKFILNESDPINKGAGLLANLIYHSRQIFTPKNPVKGLHEVPFNLVDLYLGKKQSYKNFDTYSYRNYIQMVSHTAGFTMPEIVRLGETVNLKDGSRRLTTEEDIKENQIEISQRLNFLQTTFDSNFILETLSDVTLSQSLVPTGMSDSSKMEFQYLIGMTKSQLKGYEKIGGATDGSVEVQTAYVALLGAARGDYSSFHLASDALSTKGIGYKLGFYQEGQEGFLNNQFDATRRVLMSYTNRTGNSTFTQAIDALVENNNPAAIDKLIRTMQESGYRDFEGERIKSDSINNYADATKEAVKHIYKQLERTDLSADQRDAYLKMQREIGKTKQIVLPAFDYRLNQETGLYSIHFKDPTKSAAHIGVVLGADILSHAALSFGDFKDEILTSQVGLMLMLDQNKTLMSRLYDQAQGNNAPAVTEEELNRLKDLVSVFDLSRQSLLKPVNSEIMRKAFGDHQTYVGAVGIAVNSFALTADEFLAGSRYERLAGKFSIGTTFETKINTLLMSSADGDQAEFNKYFEGFLQTSADLTSGATLEASVEGQGDKVVIANDIYRQLSSVDFKDQIYKIKLLTAQGASRHVNFSELGLSDTYLAYKLALDRSKKRASLVKQVNQLGAELNVDAELATYMAKQEDIYRQAKVSDWRSLSYKDSEMLIKAKTYGVMLGIDENHALDLLAVDLAMQTKHVEHMVGLLAGGMIGRSGMPAGAGMQVNAKRHYKFAALEMVYERLTEMRADSQASSHSLQNDVINFLIDQDRHSTGLVVPSISRLLAGLGDYDGDAYQLILSTVGQHNSFLIKSQKQLNKLLSARNNLISIQAQVQETLKPIQPDTTIPSEFYKPGRDINLARPEAGTKRVEFVDIARDVYRNSVPIDKQDTALLEKITKTKINEKDVGRLLLEIKQQALLNELDTALKKGGFRGYLLETTDASNPTQVSRPSIDLRPEFRFSEVTYSRDLIYRKFNAAPLPYIDGHGNVRSGFTPILDSEGKAITQTFNLNTEQGKSIRSETIDKLAEIISSKMRSHYRQSGMSVGQVKAAMSTLKANLVEAREFGQRLTGVAGDSLTINRMIGYLPHDTAAGDTLIKPASVTGEILKEFGQHLSDKGLQVIPSLVGSQPITNVAELTLAKTKLTGFVGTRESLLVKSSLSSGEQMELQTLNRNIQALSTSVNQYSSATRRIARLTQEKDALARQIISTPEAEVQAKQIMIRQQIAKLDSEIQTVSQAIATPAVHQNVLNAISFKDLYNYRSGTESDRYITAFSFDRLQAQQQLYRQIDASYTPSKIAFARSSVNQITSQTYKLIDQLRQLETMATQAGVRNTATEVRIDKAVKVIQERQQSVGSEAAVISAILNASSKNYQHDKAMKEAVAVDTALREIGKAATILNMAGSNRTEKLRALTMGIINTPIEPATIPVEVPLSQAEIDSSYTAYDRLMPDRVLNARQRVALKDSLSIDLPTAINLSERLANAHVDLVQMQDSVRSLGMQMTSSGNQHLTLATEYAGALYGHQELVNAQTAFVTNHQRSLEVLSTDGLGLHELYNLQKRNLEIGQRLMSMRNNDPIQNLINHLRGLDDGQLTDIGKQTKVDLLSQLDGALKTQRDIGVYQEAINYRQIGEIEKRILKEESHLDGNLPEAVIQRRDAVYKSQRMSEAYLAEHSGRMLPIQATLVEAANAYSAHINHLLTELKDQSINGHLEQEIKEAEEQVLQRQGMMTSHVEGVEKLETRVLKDMRQMLKTYLALPDFLVEGTKSFTDAAGRPMQMMDTAGNEIKGNYRPMSDGETFSLLKQKFDMTQVEHIQADSESSYQKSRRTINMFGHLYQRGAITLENLPEILRNKQQWTDTLTNLYIDALGFTPQQSTQVKESVAEMLDALSARKIDSFQTKEQVDQMLTEYETEQMNWTTLVKSLDKTFEKAVGSLMSPFEYEAAIRVIGYGGTSLIGEAYNTFLPLLDSVIMESAMYNVVQGSRGNDENAGLLDVVKGASPELNTFFSDDNKDNIKSRFFGTTALFANMQQIVRDALKSKSGDQLEGFFAEKSYGPEKNMSIGEYLTSIDDVSSPTVDNKERLLTLRRFLMERLGPTLTQQDFITGLSQGRSLESFSQQTGFGAMLTLAEYVKTPMDASGKDSLYEKFINDEAFGSQGMKQDFETWLESRPKTVNENEPITNDIVSEFLNQKIVNMIELTQASFIAANLTGGTVLDDLVKRAVDYSDLVKQSAILGEDSQLSNRRIIASVEEYNKRVITPGAVKEDLQRALVADLILETIKTRNSEFGVFNTQTVDFLRQANLGNAAFTENITNPDYDNARSRLEMGNFLAYSEYIRKLRRGQNIDMNDALEFGTFKFGLHLAALQEKGLLTTGITDAADAARHYDVLALMQGMQFSKDDAQNIKMQNDLAVLLAADGGKLFQQLAQNSAALTQAYRIHQELDQLQSQRSDQDAYERAFSLGQQLNSIVDSSGNFNIDRLQDLGQFDYRPTATGHNFQNQISNIEQALNQRISAPEDRQIHYQQERMNLKAMGNLEIAGILISPLLFALAADGMKLDARVGLFAGDMLQAGFELFDRKSNSLTSQYLINSNNEQISRGLSFEYQKARIRQTISTEGLVAGAIKGAAQELIFRGASELARAAVDKIFKPSVNRVANLATVGGTILSEILSSVFAMSFSRAMTGARGSRQSEYVSDISSRIIGNIIESIWQSTEEAQLNALSREYEVVDTEYNMNLDYDTTAVPSDLEWDIESGLVILDGDGTQVHTDFNDSDYSSMMSVGGLARS